MTENYHYGRRTDKRIKLVVLRICLLCTNLHKNANLSTDKTGTDNLDNCTCLRKLGGVGRLWAGKGLARFAFLMFQCTIYKRTNHKNRNGQFIFMSNSLVVIIYDATFKYSKIKHCCLL